MFTIELFYQLYSSDTQVYQIVPLAHYVNVTESPTLVRYGGPEWMIYNSTSNCIRAIDDPARSPVFLHCSEPDRTESKLNTWLPVVEGTEEHEKFAAPQRAQSTTESIVSCLFNKIEINGTTYDCPHYPFSLPTSTPFTLPNQGDEVKAQYINVIEKSIGYKTPHFIEKPGEPTYSALIKTLSDRNRNSVPSGKFGLENNTATIPLDLTGALAIIRLFTTMVMASSCMSRCLGNNPLRQLPLGGMVNIITGSTPSQPSTPSAQPVAQPIAAPAVYGHIQYPAVPAHQPCVQTAPPPMCGPIQYQAVSFPSPPPQMCAYSAVDHGVTFRTNPACQELSKHPDNIYDRPLSA